MSVYLIFVLFSCFVVYTTTSIDDHTLGTTGNVFPFVSTTVQLYDSVLPACCTERKGCFNYTCNTHDGPAHIDIILTYTGPPWPNG